MNLGRCITVALSILFIPDIIFESSVETQITKSHSCNKTQGCIGLKLDNFIDNADCVSDCDFTAKVKEVKNASIHFRLYSRHLDKYVAVGVSKDEKMGDDLVVICYQDSLKVTGYLSWNRGNINHRLMDQSGLKFFKGIVINGEFYCDFEIPYSIKLDAKEYDFSDTKFHFLLAGGKVEKDYIMYHDARIATSRFTVTSKLNTTSADYGAEKIHATYMMFAWFFWIPFGTFTSRFYKETWSDSYMWSKRFWFIIHTGCMVFALIMAVTAYILVLYDRDAMIPPELPESAHGIIGIVAISLLLFQCLMGWFRPSKMVPREIVAKIHCYIGITCYITGIFNVILAPYLTHNVLPCGMTVVGILWLIIHLFFALMISSFILWTDWHLQIGGWRAFCGCPMPIASNEEAVRPNLRKATLGIFILLSVVFGFVGMASMKGVPCPPTFNLKCSTTNDSLL